MNQEQLMKFTIRKMEHKQKISSKTKRKNQSFNLFKKYFKKP